jgi:hypothetical protein
MDPRQRRQREADYWAAYLAALRLQARCEMAGIDTQAEQAREIRRQARLRLVALYAAGEAA